MNEMKRRLWRGLQGLCRLLSAGLLGLAAAGPALADDLVDLRASFVRIEPYTRPPSPPVTREFSVPGPGTLKLSTTISPWFRVGEPVRFRSLVPVDGRDEAAWASRLPGAERLSSISTPERWVDGGDLTLLSEYRVRKALPRLELGLFPSAARYGDGSMLQLANAVRVTIVWIPEGAPGTRPGGPGTPPGTPPTAGTGTGEPPGPAAGPVTPGPGTGGGAGMPVNCEARDGGRVWPCHFRITQHDAATGQFEAQLEWPSLGSVHRVRGTLHGSQLRFTEVEAIRAGGAHLNVDYTMTVGGGRAEGRYLDRTDGGSGTMTIPWPAGILPATGAGPSAPPVAASLAGQVWEVVETSGGDRWIARWTVLADGRSFDASWRHEPGDDSGRLPRFATITTLDGPQIVIERPGLGRYTGTVSPDRRRIEGDMSWARGRWQVALPQPLPQRLR